MKPLFSKTCTLLGVLFLLNVPGVTGYEETGVKAAGVVFDINSDRKVEKIGGVVQPEPLDSYIKRLTQALSGQITQLDEKIERIEKKLDSALSSGKLAAAPGGENSKA